MRAPSRQAWPDADPAIVLVNCLGHSELEVLHETLTTSLNAPTVLVRPADLGHGRLTLDPVSGRLAVADQPVLPVVTWVRHATACVLLSQPAAPYASDPLAAAYWADFLAQLGVRAQIGLPGPELSPFGQPARAARLGVRTPVGLVTTDVGSAVRELAADHVVIKRPDFRVFVADPGAWPVHLPRVLTAEQAAEEPAGAGSPVLVQEYLQGYDELRVYYADGGLCAFRVDKEHPASLWSDPGAVTVTATGCPPEVAGVVSRLSRAWGLRYAAFDLLVAADGEPVFLEANPDGDWLWFERRSGWHGVSVMVAAMVKELFVRWSSRGAVVR